MTQIANPFEELIGVPMHVAWQYLNDAVPYYIEFILPLHAIIDKVGYYGAYLVIPAQVLKTQETIMFPLLKEQMVVMSLPLKTFRRAWVAVAVSSRDLVDNNDNVRIEFTKKNQKSLFITKTERVQCTPEQREFAEGVYSRPDLYSGQLPESEGDDE